MAITFTFNGFIPTMSLCWSKSHLVSSNHWYRSKEWNKTAMKLLIPMTLLDIYFIIFNHSYTADLIAICFLDTQRQRRIHFFKERIKLEEQHSARQIKALFVGSLGRLPSKSISIPSEWDTNNQHCNFKLYSSIFNSYYNCRKLNLAFKSYKLHVALFVR